VFCSPIRWQCGWALAVGCGLRIEIEFTNQAGKCQPRVTLDGNLRWSWKSETVLDSSLAETTFQASRAGLAGVRLHDLRHTSASFGAGARAICLLGLRAQQVIGCGSSKLGEKSWTNDI